MTKCIIFYFKTNTLSFIAFSCKTFSFIDKINSLRTIYNDFPLYTHINLDKFRNSEYKEIHFFEFTKHSIELEQYLAYLNSIKHFPHKCYSNWFWRSEKIGHNITDTQRYQYCLLQESTKNSNTTISPNKPSPRTIANKKKTKQQINDQTIARSISRNPITAKMRTQPNQRVPIVLIADRSHTSLVTASAPPYIKNVARAAHARFFSVTRKARTWAGGARARGL